MAPAASIYSHTAGLEVHSDLWYMFHTAKGAPGIEARTSWLLSSLGHLDGILKCL